jgi:hypothetical protein
MPDLHVAAAAEAELLLLLLTQRLPQLQGQAPGILLEALEPAPAKHIARHNAHSSAGHLRDS